MASVIATAKPRLRRKGAAARTGGGYFGLPVSRLGRTIIVLNFLGLAILVTGALIQNEREQGLVDAQKDNLRVQAQFIQANIEGFATRGEPEPHLDADAVRAVFLDLYFPTQLRARVFDAQGNLIADSFHTVGRFERSELPPLRKPGGVFRLDPRIYAEQGRPRDVERAAEDLASELRRAREGEPQAHMRPTPNGGRVVSVSLPIQHVRAVTGVLTVEAGNVDEIIAAQRWALVPFIIIAGLVTLISSLMLNQVIAQPVRRLARAADAVRLSRARSISLPDIDRRNDELGDLSRSLESMTTTLSERMDAIERFAADVAHEIRNPLTSIRSAVETLDLVDDPRARARLNTILKQDVSRLDRLITDISNASRLDAELSRDSPRPLDLRRLLTDIVSLYRESSKPDDPTVRLKVTPSDAVVTVAGREGPLGQVFRNLIDNARSFAPLSTRTAAPEVRVSLGTAGGEALVTVEDDGPGIPPENLETVFERFYTSRPKGAAFGGNSGLGLSIARQIVTAHGGRVWAENRMDKTGQVLGARFSVALPLRRQTA